MSRMRPSAAMVVAIIALIASVTSGAYAAVRITTRDIADGAVTQPKLAANSVWHANIGGRSARNNNIADRAVNNRTLAANSVWHAQIGTGSVQRNNVQAQLLTELQAPSIAFGLAATPGSSVPTTSQTVATGNIATTDASQKHLLLNGFVLVQRTAGVIGDTVTCEYSVNNGTPSTFGTVTRTTGGNAIGGEMQVMLVGQTVVTPGTHTINVSCSQSDAAFDLQGGGFTAAITG